MRRGLRADARQTFEAGEIGVQDLGAHGVWGTGFDRATNLAGSGHRSYGNGSLDNPRGDRHTARRRIGAMTINVDLGKLEGFVAELVRSGRYGSEAEVVTEALRLLQAQEHKLAALDEAIARGIADADAGRVKPAEEVLARLAAKYSAMTRGIR
ncbi:type II toxin-antitoxin system ParD family antitoxin [Methyloraptor flagellatus]